MPFAVNLAMEVEKRRIRGRTYRYESRGQERHCEIGDLPHGFAIPDSGFSQPFNYCVVLRRRRRLLPHGLTEFNMDRGKHLEPPLEYY